MALKTPIRENISVDVQYIQKNLSRFSSIPLATRGSNKVDITLYERYLNPLWPVGYWEIRTAESPLVLLHFLVRRE